MINYRQFKTFQGQNMNVFDAFFPNPFLRDLTPEERFRRLVRRECRGIVLSKNSGKILARRFHKFFAINQLRESHMGIHSSKLENTDPFLKKKHLSADSKVV